MCVRYQGALSDIQCAASKSATVDSNLAKLVGLGVCVWGEVMLGLRLVLGLGLRWWTDSNLAKPVGLGCLCVCVCVGGGGVMLGLVFGLGLGLVLGLRCDGGL